MHEVCDVSIYILAIKLGVSGGRIEYGVFLCCHGCAPEVLEINRERNLI